MRVLFSSGEKLELPKAEAGKLFLSRAGWQILQALRAMRYLSLILTVAIVARKKRYTKCE